MKKGYACLLSIISDGQDYSGEYLAKKLGVTRAAIWKLIKQLQSSGLPIEATHGKGYRLHRKIELLSEKKIRSSLSSFCKKNIRQIDVLFETSSTNTYLLEQFSFIHGTVVLAEHQSAGKGRRGNHWLSPLASGLYLSIGWRFDKAPAAPGLLALYAGVAVVRALKELGMNKIDLKWPNDILIGNKKLGGILLEMRGEACGEVDIVTGIGINYDLPEVLGEEIEHEVTDICKNTNQTLSRNKIAASLISNIFDVFNMVQSETEPALLDEWRKYDCYQNAMAKLLLPDNEVCGLLKGVDDQGALLISVDDEIQHYTSGEISLRVPR